MRELTNIRSGKLGAVVCLKTRYGQVERQYVKPRNPRTPAQVRIRTIVAQLAAHWRTLTEEQRAAWTRKAKEAHARHRLGQSSHLTGCQFYIKINSARAAVGLSPLVYPPEMPEFGDSPVGELVITNNDGAISLKLEVSGTPGADIVVLGIAPCSAGVSYVWNFVTLGLLPAPTSGWSDITDLYVARFGVPRVGMKVFIRTRQQINGWEELPVQTSAIVPQA
jgi:hypothetical protein